MLDYTLHLVGVSKPAQTAQNVITVVRLNAVEVCHLIR